MRLLLLITMSFLIQGCIPFSYSGRVPHRQISLQITDEAHQPIPQARVVAKTKALETPKEGLAVTQEGTIELLSPGYRYGGGCLLVLGIVAIPPPPKDPSRERYEVRASGFRSVRFHGKSLFEKSHGTAELPIVRDGKTNSAEVLLYERHIILRQR